MSIRLHERTNAVTQAHNEADLMLVQEHWRDFETYDAIVEFHCRELMALVNPGRVGQNRQWAHIAEKVNAIWAKFELTEAEQVRFHGKQIDDAGRYWVRAERHHNDPDRKGDEA